MTGFPPGMFEWVGLKEVEDLVSFKFECLKTLILAEMTA